MGLRTADEFLEGLDDGRRVYYQHDEGEKPTPRTTPRRADDLSARSQLIELATVQGATMEAFSQRWRDEDLALALAQTDAKGDRSLAGLD